MPQPARSKRTPKPVGKHMGFCAVALLLPCAVWAGEATLHYQGTNLWVAEAENAPLRQVLRAAKQGATQFKVGLPQANRALSKARLGVLVMLLEKQQGRGITIVETMRPKALSNTLRIVWE